jgi:hypothetical protein
MGAEQIGTTSSILGSRTTTSVLVPGSESTCASTPLIGGYCSSQLGGCSPSITSVAGAEGSASTVAVSMPTASGIVAPSACAPTTMTKTSQLQQLRLLHTIATSHEVHIPSTKVASPNVNSTAASICGGGVGLRSAPSSLLHRWSAGLLAVPRQIRGFFASRSSRVSNARLLVYTII